jgi:hypothetical protein
MSTFKKNLSVPDKFFIAINELRPPFVIQLVLEGDGDPAPELLDEALEKTTRANPGSSLALHEDGDTAYWTLGPEPTLTLFDAPAFEAGSGENAPFLMWPMDAKKGPTCELVAVRGKEKTYLVFRALHAVMDGRGTLAWVKDFMRCLRGEEPVGHPSMLTVDELIRDMDTPRRKVPEADSIHPFGRADLSAKGSFHWRRITAPRPLAGNASGRIAVAIAERARRGGRQGNVRINLPVDLRHYVPHERTTGNLFSGLFLDVLPEATADGLALGTVKALYQQDETKTVGISWTHETGSLAAFRVKVFWDLHHLHDEGLYAFSATLSHLGMLRQAELSAPIFTTTSAFFVPLVGDSGCVVSLNGFDDHTEVAVGLSDRFTREGQLDELAELVRRALE